jgi:hypothetical protein
MMFSEIVKRKHDSLDGDAVPAASLFVTRESMNQEEREEGKRRIDTCSLSPLSIFICAAQPTSMIHKRTHLMIPVDDARTEAEVAMNPVTSNESGVNREGRPRQLLLIHSRVCHFSSF